MCLCFWNLVYSSCFLNLMSICFPFVYLFFNAWMLVVVLHAWQLQTWQCYGRELAPFWLLGPWSSVSGVQNKTVIAWAKMVYGIWYIYIYNFLHIDNINNILTYRNMIYIIVHTYIRNKSDTIPYISDIYHVPYIIFHTYVRIFFHISCAAYIYIYTTYIYNPFLININPWLLL